MTREERRVTRDTHIVCAAHTDGVCVLMSVCDVCVELEKETHL